MTEKEYKQRNQFRMYVVALPYLLFGLIVALLLTFASQPIWLVTVLGVFMVYNVIATFTAFLFKYGKETLYLLFLTLCITGVFGFFVNTLFKGLS
ncbi:MULTISPECIES: hypothetical protein [unclassified Staphylococcus]|uniref:hypothetical protein n=1 Tax=unclassified Staphylococcus TaxID=91994 RepID=UPI0021D1D82C|nr:MULTISPECIES: hypothetical protein [unclassified Staphylococcus]UXR69941.1 hypothetical protein MUA26_01990 [Staphylococcus sp. IVB6246]UXR71980.1 hypothetical protein MUA88_01965 [Staphylococcus sp. IVB6240]UXR74288.1 hypothetical protein MUA48_02140 [Staphylococcus sp. IVB6238]UXR76675.1 hypothetical protein MUA74_02505 [Staphylococcus sp. IVB6233]UXR80804.1 hypothetical protein MUA65_02120 [Staphylococcus sp. IVB6218]